MIVLLELGLEFGHIHARRTLGLAGFTGQTKIHDLLNLLAIEGVFGIRRLSENLAQDICAGTGGVLFLTSGHVARAHRAAGLRSFAAVARSVAFLGSAKHTHGVAKIKDRFVIRRPLPRAVTQRGIHRRGVHDLSRVKDIFGIK